MKVLPLMSMLVAASGAIRGLLFHVWAALRIVPIGGSF